MPGAVHLVREVLRGHGRKFGLAVCGAALFAGGTVASSMLVGRLTDRVIVPRFTDGQVSAGVVAGVLGLVLLVGALRAGGVLLRRSFVTRTIWGVTDSLTGRVLDRLVAQPPVWHRRRSTGELIARAGVDPEAAGSVLGPLPYATSVVLLVLAAGVWLVVVDPVLGLAAVLVVPLMTMLNVGYQRAADRRFAVAQDQLGALGAAVHESVAGAAVVRAFGGRGREVERLAVVAHRLRDERMRIVDLRSTFEALLDALPALVNLGLLLGGAVRVRSGAMTVGDLLGVSYLFTLVVFPLRVIGYAAAELPRSRAGWARLGEVLDAPVEPDPAATLVRTTGDVDVTGLTVAYEPGAEVVSGVTLHVGAGERVAVVGHTGAGKTTLLHALAGLLPAAAGTVAVPDVVMLVPQEAFLVSGTVRDNVTLGAPIDDDAVRAALAIADAGFVDDLPGGLDATVGERGSGLSGGQRQRIALARSLARHPALLLLDDTTSALDPGTERRVLDRLRTTPGMSTVAVASRPAVVAVADDVVFMAGGRIADRGPHAVLVARDPSYAALVRAFADHEREQHEREQHVQQRGAAAEQRRGDEP